MGAYVTLYYFRRRDAPKEAHAVTGRALGLNQEAMPDGRK